MSRPEDIPQDVWDRAAFAVCGFLAVNRVSFAPVERTARAILAERERCAKVAESDFHRARAGLSVAAAIRTGGAA